MRLPGIASHHSARSQTDEWLTPPHITAALGPFDLDPATTPANPVGATSFFTVEDDGLDHEWVGRVWLNPPYSEVEAWMARLARHGTGTALVFARTDTRWFHDVVWAHAAGMLFLRGRLSFARVDGEQPRAGHNAGGPSVLVAFGASDAERLRGSGLAGHYVTIEQ